MQWIPVEWIILGITGVCMYNLYTDGACWKYVMHHKKYLHMAFYAVLGLGFYAMWKRRPEESRRALHYAHGMARFLPVDRQTLRMVDPVFDWTNPTPPPAPAPSPYTYSPLHSAPLPSLYGERAAAKQGGGRGTRKRSVSETKKKYVAANQHWKCGHCQHQLDHTFEIDHRIRLEYGGSNEVENLIALCRNCHGIKTASENM